MGSIDYYRLLKEGPTIIKASDWDEALKAVVHQKETETHLEEACEALQNIIFDGSSEWLEKKNRIIQGAEKSHTNPRLMSDYCLNSIKALCAEASKQAALKEDAPELTLIYRQVSDHLRKLNNDNKLVSERLRTKKGRDLCNMWGLPDWGESWLKRPPAAAMEEILEELPIIRSLESGKGLFDYNTTLPGYLPTVLLAYSAALSTSQMSSTVVARISPPLAQTSISSDRDEAQAEKPESLTPWYVRIPGPEQLLRYKELRERFLRDLTDREKRVYEMKEAGFAIDEIARELDCSPKTVNNDWRNVFSKCRQAVAA